MDKISYSQIIASIKQASAFDLFRLKCAINFEMESPKKITAVKSQLIIGSNYEYFDETENKARPCKLLKINETRAVVEDLATNKTWGSVASE